MFLPKELKFFLTRKMRAHYIGFVGYGNLGDEALYWAINDLFRKQILFFDRMQYGHSSRFLKNLLTVQAIFLGGGTLIKPTKIFLQQLDQAFAIYPQAKFIVFGTGVGDAELWESFGKLTDKAKWLQYLEDSKFLSVRGPLSKQFLLEWGITKDVEVIGDPVIWFLREKIVPKKNLKRIGLNLGPSSGNVIGGEEKILDFGAELLQKLSEDGWQVTLFPMCSDDTDYMLEAVRRANCPMPYIHTKFLNLNATLDALEDQDVFIGEKLHSVILASCVCTPAIMLAYRTKCRDFMLSIDREEWTYPTDQLDAELIFDRLKELYSEKKIHQQTIYRQMTYLKTKLITATKKVLLQINNF